MTPRDLNDLRNLLALFSAVLQCKMAELGYADCKIMFVTHESDSASETKDSSC